MAYKVIILYRLYMPSYFLGTFTEYPYKIRDIVSYTTDFNSDLLVNTSVHLLIESLIFCCCS